MKRCPSCQSAFPTNYTHCPRDGYPSTEAGEWTEGTLVRGKYQIIAKVGQGGMAAVYKALHVRFKEPRALKVMNPELANDATFVKRFEQEAIITRRLQHPNAVRVEDIDEAEDGRPFIVMEYVEGGNLKDVIEREAPIPVARVCAIVKQIAAALDAAHTLGLVHRDIKPANIALLASSGQAGRSSDRGNYRDNDRYNDRVKILDFGIAKLREAHLEESKTHMTLTGTGMVIGTPAYMSPEQAKGLKGAELDGRSDLYSLGVVMYQMLTGDLPLKADSTLELLMAHISTPPRPIHEARPDLYIPDSVADVVMRCLEKNRELRPASGQGLIDEINFASVLQEKPSVTLTPPRKADASPTVDPPASPTVIAESEKSRSRSWLWAVAAILIAAALAGAWYLRGRTPPTEQQGSHVASTSSEPEPVAPHIEEPPTPAPAQQPQATKTGGAPLILTGTVTNGTSGMPAVGDHVILINMTANGMDEAGNTKVGSNGEFSFKITLAGPHLIRAVHQGITYHQVVPPDVSTTDVKVYDVRHSAEPWGACAYLWSTMRLRPRRHK
jgi:serine/threonine protein kinase